MVGMLKYMQRVVINIKTTLEMLIENINRLHLAE